MWAAQPQIATRRASARAVAVPARKILRPVDEPTAEVAVVFWSLVADQQRRVGDNVAAFVLRANRVVTDRCCQQRPFNRVGGATGCEEFLNVERQRIEKPRRVELADKNRY